MAITCSKLTAGLVGANCNKQVVSGVDGEIILINYDDVDRKLSVLTGNVISSIIMKTGLKGFMFETLSRAGLGESTVNKGTYRNSWQQDVTLRIFTKNELSKTFVNNLTNSNRVIAIVKNKDQGDAGETKYEAYGWESGLELNEGTTTTDFADGVAYTLKVGSSETSQEATLPKSIFKTDLATTETMIKTLV